MAGEPPSHYFLPFFSPASFICSLAEKIHLKEPEKNDFSSSLAA
jgi:hypothetical protein